MSKLKKYHQKARQMLNTFFMTTWTISDPSDIKCKVKSSFIFDDVMLEKGQSKVEYFYTRGHCE